MSAIFRWLIPNWLISSCYPKQTELQEELDAEAFLTDVQTLISRANAALAGILVELSEVQRVIDDPQTHAFDRTQAEKERSRLLLEFKQTKSDIELHTGHLTDVLTTKSDVQSVELSMQLQNVKSRILRKGEITDARIDDFHNKELDNRARLNQLASVRRKVIPRTQAEVDSEELGLSKDLLQRATPIDDDDAIARKLLGLSPPASSSVPIASVYIPLVPPVPVAN